MILDRIETINRLTRETPAALVADAEQRFGLLLDDAVQRLRADAQKRIILLAGPSASGKTTSAALLTKRLAALGSRAVTVSLDDFYKERQDAPSGADGMPDYESVHALDLDEMHRCFFELVETGRSALPLFDFASGGLRAAQRRELALGAGDVIIVEGLHALNPLIAEALPAPSLFKIYISVSTRLHNHLGATVFSKTQLRFLRRMVRDYQFRASSVENTYQLWQNVLRGEEEYLFPFRHTADVRINSMHAYEAGVLRGMAQPLLRQVTADSRYAADAAQLCAKLDAVAPLEAALVPEGSLLREFIGGLVL